MRVLKLRKLLHSKIGFLVGALCCGFLNACAPSQINRIYNEHPLASGQRVEDPQLDLSRVHWTSAHTSQMLHWTGDVSARDFFSSNEDLFILSRERNDAALARLGFDLQNAFFAQPTVLLTASPYAHAAVGETEQDSAAEIKKQSQILSLQPALVNQVLALTTAQLTIPTRFENPTELILTVKKILDLFLKNLKKSSVDARVRAAIAQRLDQVIFPELVQAHADILIVFNQPNAVDFLRGLQSFLGKYKLGLDPATNTKIDGVVALIEEAQRMQSPQDVLTTIVELWELLTPEERATNFKPVSKELYDFLSIQSPVHLSCLKHQSCPDPLLQIVMHAIILPAIDSRGVGQIRDQIIQGIRAGVMQQLNSEAGAQFHQLPQIVSTNVSDEIGALLKVLAKISGDYGGFLKGVLSRVAVSPGFLPQKASGRITGFEPELIRVAIASRDHLSVQSKASGDASVTGASAIGTGFQSAVARLQAGAMTSAHADQNRQVLLTQINKLLALAGFHQEGGKLFDSLYREVTVKGFSDHLDLRHYLSDTSRSYAVPDRLALTSPFDMSEQIVSHGGDMISAAGQADLLRGLISLVRYSQDWNSNSFDTLLGGVTIDRFVPELPAGSIHQNLFPKDLIFAASLGATAVLLERIANANTPVFLIGLNQQTFWANSLTSDSASAPGASLDRLHPDPSPSAMAGIVSTLLTPQQLIRGDDVRTEDVALTVLGLCEFLDATQDIQKTQNDLLIKRGKDGKNAVDTINDVRGKLKLLILAFSNFMTHQMQSADGGLAESFNRKSFRTSQTPRRLVDQTIAIRALVAAGAALDMDLYRWAALDAYSFMNRELYIPSAGFYSAAAGEPVAGGQFSPILATLRAGESLRPLMAPRSQAQWDELSRPWFEALDRF